MSLQDDEEFNKDLDKLIQSAKQLMMLCKIEGELDDIDHHVQNSSLTDARAMLDHIILKMKRGDYDEKDF